ncbi:MAG TPA: PepSY-like domain-containing protein [Verrucomicrobiae bacterium]|nr:PepSY-like domain-containing protein [Verrucomicrobiae bacterium]
MKKNFAIIVMLGACAFIAWAEKITETQLPPAVQRTLSQHKGSDAIKDIEKETRNGRTVYEVEFSRTGLNPKLVIAEDGSIVRDARERNDRNANTVRRDSETRVNEPRASRIATMRVDDVPAAVRKTIEEHAAGRKVADIDRETWNGKPVFEVEYDQTGRNEQIFVSEDGTIVKQEGKVRTPESAAGAIKGPVIGTRFSDTPAAVQETIKREAKGAEIADIDKERRNGRVLYEVEFKDPGRNREIHIAEDGSIVPDNRRDTRALGAPGSAPQTRTGTRGNNLTLDQAPPAVQAAIRANGDPTTIKEIERGEKGGRTVYTVEFEKEGRNKKVQIAEDGSVLKDNRQ